MRLEGVRRQARMFFLWIRVKIGRPLCGVDFARLSSLHVSVNAAPWPTDKLAGFRWRLQVTHGSKSGVYSLDLG